MNDGGPAFPLAAGTGDPRDGVHCQTGMTLRDWFAGQALAGLLANPQLHATCDQYASMAIAAADAMLKARLEGGAQ